MLFRPTTLFHGKHSVRYTGDEMRGTQSGGSVQGSVPPPAAVMDDLARWARGQVLPESGYVLRVGWSDTGPGRGRVAAVAGVEAHPAFPKPRSDVAQRLGQRLCVLLSATLPAVAQLAARGVPARDVLTVLWRLDRNRSDAPKRRRQRAAEAKVLEQAALIVERYRPILERHTPWLRVQRPGDPSRWSLGHAFYPDGAWLAWIAENLRGMPPRRAGAPPEWRALASARALEVLVKRAGSKVIAREISAVVAAAWGPEAHWHGEDPGRAARALLARARQRVTLKQLEQLLAFGGEDIPGPAGPGLGDDALRAGLDVRASAQPTARAAGRPGRNVPVNVPASTRSQPKPTPRRPRAKRKTPR